MEPSNAPACSFIFLAAADLNERIVVANDFATGFPNRSPAGARHRACRRAGAVPAPSNTWGKLTRHCAWDDWIISSSRGTRIAVIHKNHLLPSRYPRQQSPEIRTRCITSPRSTVQVIPRNCAIHRLKTDIIAIRLQLACCNQCRCVDIELHFLIGDLDAAIDHSTKRPLPPAGI